MKFKTINAYYQDSECGKYRIAHSKVNGFSVFTLTSGGKILATERCRDNATERVEAVNLLKELAGEHEK